MSYSPDFYEKIGKAVDIDEKKFEDIKQGAILFFKGVDYNPENIMDYMLSYLKQNHPEMSGKVVRIGSRNSENSFTISMDNIYSTKPIEEILCDVIQDKN